jgi:two-component system chemotaxis response regulator CheY
MAAPKPSQVEGGDRLARKAAPVRPCGSVQTRKGSYEMATTILIVDDALFTRMMLRNILSENGFNAVVEAETGTEAIWAYERWKPDIVIMDINMPEMDGMTAIKNILRIDPQAKIIICSALGERQLMLEALEEGVVDFITKPFQPEKVLEVIKKTLS